MLKVFWKRKELLLLCLILIVGLFLRMYHLPRMVGFDFDQEYAAQFAQTILQVYPIQMIGQGLSVPGLFMGPWYFYYLVPFFALTHLHPLGGYIGSSILGLIITAAYYVLLKPVFGAKTALLAAFFRAILFTRLLYDWTMAPSYSSELAVLFTWYCIYRYWNGNTNYLPLLAFTFGMYTSFHPILFPFFAGFVILFFIKRRLPSFKILVFSLVLFLIPLFPLLRFEYYRHFLEVKTLFSLHTSSKSEVKTLQTFISYLLIVFRLPTSIFYFHFSETINLVINCAVYASLLLAAVKRIGFWKNLFHPIFLLLTMIIFLVYYFFLPTHVPEYYFLGIEILIYIYVIATLGLLFKRKFFMLAVGISIVILIFNFWALWGKWQENNSISLADKDYVLQKILTLQKNDKNFAVYTNADPGQQFGMGYLERYYHINVGGNPQTTYEIVLPADRATQKPSFTSPSGLVGVIVHKE